MNRIAVRATNTSGFVAVSIITETRMGKRQESCTLRANDVDGFIVQQALHRPVVVTRHDMGGIVKVQPPGCDR